MPDAAVKRDPDTLRDDPAARTRRRRATLPDELPLLQDSADAEKKLARAARSAQRLAQLSEDTRGGETLDLFAEDAERAQQQALNTDIRQGTFEGFELPEVFLAAVQSGCATAATAGGAAESAASKRAARGSTASVSAVTPAQGLFQGELLDTADAPPAQTQPVDKPGAAMPAAVARASSISTPVAPESPEGPPVAVASARVGQHHAGIEAAAGASARREAPELDRARATAFADTIDALYAVIAEQRTSAGAHARRMKTMQTIIVCVMLATVATGIAQTLVLVHMSRDGKLQQDRMEQLMLSQQATLASLFDTDSATVSMHGAPTAPRESEDASPVQPVSAVRPDSAPKKPGHHAHHRAASSAH